RAEVEPEDVGGFRHGLEEHRPVARAAGGGGGLAHEPVADQRLQRQRHRGLRDAGPARDLGARDRGSRTDRLQHGPLVEVLEERGIGLLVALVLGAALMAATARSSATAGTSGAKVDNITIWVGWSAAELKAFKGVVAEYDSKHSDVTVKVVGGINDDKITAAIRSG